MYIAVSYLMLLHTFKLHWSINITFIYIGKIKKNHIGLRYCKVFFIADIELNLQHL